MFKTKEIQKKLNKKGISLIVLVITIIVIIILAAAVILTLTGNNPIENAKQATYINDLSTFQDELDMYKTNEYAKNQGDFDQTILDVTGEDIYTYIPSMTGKTKYIAELAILDGRLIYTGPTDSPKKTWAAMANILEGTVPVIPEIPVATGANVPVLATGMTAIKWNSTTNAWDNVSNPTTDTSWYSYTETDKQWANAKTVDGSMWVWIPRYEYKITNTHTSTAQTIDINFINGTGNGIGGDYTTTYGLHPAFTFDTQLKGIWVAKFEASGTTSAVNVLPGVASLRNITIDAMFTACRIMENNTAKYGWSTTDLDTHLMKNIEWGAVAYLSSSIYGKVGEVGRNSNASYYTGGGSGTLYTTNVLQSTTGNIYGVYDMNGCSYEYTSAYVNNGNLCLTTYCSSLLSAANKYKDVYVIGTTDTDQNNYIANLSKKGDAVYETSTLISSVTSWYNDYSRMPNTVYPVFLRGRGSSDVNTDGAFAFDFYSGEGYINTSFRPVVAVAGGI